MAMRENVTRGDFAPKGHHPTTMARADAAGAAALVTAQGVTANRRRLAMNNDAPLTPPKSRDRVGHIRTENTLHPNPDLSETVQRMVPATQRARSRVDGSPMFDAKGKPLMEKILDTITGREINIPAMLPDKVDPVTGDTIKGGPDTYRRPTVSTSHDDSIMFPPAAKAEAAAKVKPKGTAPRKQKTIYGDYMPLP